MWQTIAKNPLLNEINYRSYMLSTILLILLILFLVGSFPTWPYSTGWGYGPSSVLGIVLLVLLILMLMGRI
jgi:Protein of unknown function (DUF3309)